MKNKLNYILLGILVSFSFMNNVFAEDTLDFEVYVENNNIEVVSGTETSIMVGVKSNSSIYACDFVVSSDNGIEFVSVEQMVGTYSAVKGEGGINVIDNSIDSSAPIDGTNIMQLNYKVNTSGKITIKTDECISFDDEKTGTYKDIEVNFIAKDLSQDNTLKSVKINGEMIPSFSPDGNNYAVVLEKPNFSLGFETTNPDFQDDVVVKFNGDIVNDLNNIVWSSPYHDSMGELAITVNDQKTYLIALQYTVKDLDNTLKSLEINGKSVDLQEGKTNYNIKVEKDVTNIEVEAILNDPDNFKIEEPFVNGKLTNGCSGNTCSFQIEIVPVDDTIGGSSLSYIIEVVKEGGGASSQPSSKPTSSSKPVSGDIDKNPQTGDISMFLMALILISSLVGSVLLYQKNMEGYK